MSSTACGGFISDPDLSGRLLVGGDSRGMSCDGKQQQGVEVDREQSLGGCSRSRRRRTSSKDKRVYFVGTADGVFRSEDGRATVCEEGRGPVRRRPDRLCGRLRPGGNDPVRLHALYGRRGNLAGGCCRSPDEGEMCAAMHERRHRRGGQVANSSNEENRPTSSFTDLGRETNPKRAYFYCPGRAYYPPTIATDLPSRTMRASPGRPSIFPTSDSRPGMECNVATDWQTEGLGNRWQGPCAALGDRAPADPDMVVLTPGAVVRVYEEMQGERWKLPHSTG